MANTGWTWDQAGTLTIPRLRALMREWSQRPPTHRLVAMYMGYTAPPAPAPSQAPATPSADDDGKPPAWLSGMGGIPASQDVIAATTTAEALAAFERQFFGEVKDVRY